MSTNPSTRSDSPKDTKKSFWARLWDALDKKMEEKAKSSGGGGCCAGGNGAKKC